MVRLTAREEDYLETIYRITTLHERVGVTDVARARNVTVPTARTAVAKLAKYGLVSKEHYGKIILNDTGKKQAKQIYAVHKALLRFLTNILMIDKELAEKEACRMEHGLSKKTLQRLVQFLEEVDKRSGGRPPCTEVFREQLNEN